jgi:hypothetical protein
MTVGRGGGEVATNTAVGASALAANTTGLNNVAVGVNALDANTTASGHVAIGADALGANTTGARNTAVGSNALLSNTTGLENTAISRNALYTNSTGSYNTALGLESLYSNTTGSYNTAVGYQAKYAGIGGYNSCFGVGSGLAFTSGSENTLIGFYAGASLTTGNKNLFIGGAQGSGSGGLITTGNSNTIIGSFSGNQGSVDIRTSSNNIVLSDGDGNPRMFCDGAGYWNINTGSTFGAMLGIRLITATTGDGIITRPDANVAYSAMVFKNSSGGNNGYISVSNSNTTSYVTTSDYRLKENVTPMTGALAKVAQLKPVTYDWKSGGSSQGFIAHELQAVVPDAVVGEKDALDKDGNPDYQGIDTSFLVATLTAALQELNAKFDAYVASHP